MKQYLAHWQRWSGVVMASILAFSFFTRFLFLDLPKGYIFDEVYHAVTAKLIARNDPWAFEWWNPPIEPNTAVDWLHPPLAKYTQALGIKAFGETPFGWRVSSALFGVAVIAMVYALSEELFGRRGLSLLAAGLASLDGLLLVMSRLAMNDIHVTFMILFTMWLYLRYRRQASPLWLVGVSAGLAMGTKWSGLFVLGWVWIGETQRIVLYCQKHWPTFWTQLKLMETLKTIIGHVLCLGVLPILGYVGSYIFMFAQGKDWQHFRDLHQQIWWYQTSLEATHGYQSRPWEWFLNWRPVWFFVEYGEGTISNIYAQGNPVLMWLGVVTVVITLCYLIWQTWQKPQQLLTFTPLKAAIIGYFIVWLPWVISPRIMFYYHYTPAVPLLTIIVAYWLVKLWEKGYQVLVVTTVLLIFLTFAVWYPNWTNIAVSSTFAQDIYFILPNWR